MSSENKLDQVYNRIIEQVADNMKSYGFPGTIGRVYAIIYFEGKPLDLDTLSEKTGMSKTRMSQVLREMAQINLAEKVFMKGSRKDFYDIDRDYYQNFISMFTSNFKSVVSRNKNLERKNIADLKQIIEDPSSSEEEKERAKAFINETQKSIEYFDWIDRLVEFFDSHEVFKYVPKKD
ncbi:DNA-binding transcriptional regulator GbsR (MarR family) [Salirhabdus euzebyi]|uniref:HTH-type transcriptional regulator n=1 Tax=Salirhabdus euzebyi TaxID=394506 RepID=A0A841Q6J3_9BACI|nr:GbsR/MarR family transcriptional regulator [Salirhabdus euzebyi]MBB6453947.1 DNA-binding transcriptional regulator GbsR (MarR family) [Salirhabdus euzebyi]